MFKVKKYPHGHFSWADGQSTDIATSKAFHAELMGWTYDDLPMDETTVYTVLKSDGEYVAGLRLMPPEVQAQGIPSRWNSCVNVDDVNAVVTRVATLGGAVLMEPVDVSPGGRMAMIQDPTGASLGLWQAKQHKGAGLVNTPGAMCWNELITPDSKAAQDFYAQLLGWTYQEWPGMDYHTVMNSNRANAGIIHKPAGMGDMLPMWTMYFSVADIEQTVEKAPLLGGMVLGGDITDAGDIGRFATIADPTGMTAAFIQLKKPQPWDL